MNYYFTEQMSRNILEQQYYVRFWEKLGASLKAYADALNQKLSDAKLQASFVVKQVATDIVTISFGGHTITLGSDNRTGEYVYTVTEAASNSNLPDNPASIRGTFKVSGPNAFHLQVELDGSFGRYVFDENEFSPRESRWPLHEMLAEFFCFKLVNPKKDDARFFVKE